MVLATFPGALEALPAVVWALVLRGDVLALETSQKAALWGARLVVGVEVVEVRMGGKG
jgi:hypothetical protein